MVGKRCYTGAVFFFANRCFRGEEEGSTLESGSPKQYMHAPKTQKATCSCVVLYYSCCNK